MSIFFAEMMIALHPDMDVKEAAKQAFIKSEELYLAYDELYEERRSKNNAAWKEYDMAVKNDKKISKLRNAIENNYRSQLGTTLSLVETNKSNKSTTQMEEEICSIKRQIKLKVGKKHNVRLV
jgi:hypothetical protein